MKRLPTAHACICTIDMPAYPTQECLEERLRVVLLHGKFEFECVWLWKMSEHHYWEHSITYEHSNAGTKGFDQEEEDDAAATPTVDDGRDSSSSSSSDEKEEDEEEKIWEALDWNLECIYDD